VAGSGIEWTSTADSKSEGGADVTSLFGITSVGEPNDDLPQTPTANSGVPGINTTSSRQLCTKAGLGRSASLVRGKRSDQFYDSDFGSEKYGASVCTWLEVRQAERTWSILTPNANRGQLAAASTTRAEQSLDCTTQIQTPLIDPAVR